MKPREEDLAKENQRWVVFAYAWIGSLIPMMLLIMIIASYAGASIQMPPARAWIVYQALFLGLPAIPGLLLLHYRRPIILRFDFKWTCLAGLVGRAIRVVGLVVLVAIAIIAYIPILLPQSDLLSQLLRQVDNSIYLGIVSVIGLIVLGVGGVMEGYFGVFPQLALARLYFGQARETRACDQKLGWIDSGLDSIREAASEFGLDFDNSWFKQNYAIRLFDGQNLDRELDQVSTSLSGGDSVMTALGQMGAITSEQFKLRQSTRNRAAVMIRDGRDLIQILLALAVLSLEAVLKVIFHF